MRGRGGRDEEVSRRGCEGQHGSGISSNTPAVQRRKIELQAK